MAKIRISEIQRKALNIIEEEKCASVRNIAEKTGLKSGTIIEVLRSLVCKGLIYKKWYLGFYLYYPTGLEYEIKASYSDDEEQLFKFIKDHKGVTRNHISSRLGFNWKKTVRLITSLEKKGFVKKIEYNGIKIYIIKGS